MRGAVHVGCDIGTRYTVVHLASSVTYTGRDYRRAGHRAEVETLVPMDEAVAANSRLLSLLYLRADNHVGGGS